LLYVAVTRAKEKLIVSGHSKRKKDGTLSLGGWLERLGGVAGLAEMSIKGELVAPQTIQLGFGVSCTLFPALSEPLVSVERGRKELSVERVLGAEESLDLLAPLSATASQLSDEKTRSRESEPPIRVWRVVPRAKRPTGPAWVVGKLVHEAIRRWRFPDTPDLEVFLYPHALEAGLTDRTEIANAMREARRLLERFRVHPLWAEMNAAQRWHELPYTIAGTFGMSGAGIIDILYRNGDAWTIADFKTDEIRRADQVADQIAAGKYDEQLRHYANAIMTQLGIRPRTILVFLNVKGRVMVI
jgi:ATP-dependent exoDNAse (exonuclease V) beta subunit